MFSASLTWIVVLVAYHFIAVINGQTTFKVGDKAIYTTSASFGCNEPACQAEHTLIIDQSKEECLNPTIQVSIIETDFDTSTEQAFIYIINNLIATCEPLNDDCTFDDITCHSPYDSNETQFNISNYFNPSLTTNYISISIVSTENVNFGGCMYSYNNEEYLLFGTVILSCDLPASYTLPPTTEPTTHPTPEPTPLPTRAPTWRPTPNPVFSPTSEPTPDPTPHPTHTFAPSNSPTSPSSVPTAIPTNDPTFKPTLSPIVYDDSEIGVFIKPNEFFSDSNDSTSDSYYDAYSIETRDNTTVTQVYYDNGRLFISFEMTCDGSGCAVTELAYINGICNNASVEFEYYSGDFSWSSEYFEIWFNRRYFGNCADGFEGDCNHRFESCNSYVLQDTGLNPYDIGGRFLNASKNGEDGFVQEYLSIELDATNQVNFFCSGTGSEQTHLLQARVVIGCELACEDSYNSYETESIKLADTLVNITDNYQDVDFIDVVGTEGKEPEQFGSGWRLRTNNGGLFEWYFNALWYESPQYLRPEFLDWYVSNFTNVREERNIRNYSLECLDSIDLNFKGSIKNLYLKIYTQSENDGLDYGTWYRSLYVISINDVVAGGNVSLLEDSESFQSINFGVWENVSDLKNITVFSLASVSSNVNSNSSGSGSSINITRASFESILAISLSNNPYPNDISDDEVNINEDFYFILNSISIEYACDYDEYTKMYDDCPQFTDTRYYDLSQDGTVEPTNMPSNTPTSKPTASPTGQPTGQPTHVPTTADVDTSTSVSVSTTRETTDEPGSGGNNSDENESSLGDGVVIAIIICVTVIILALLAGVTIYYTTKSKNLVNTGNGKSNDVEAQMVSVNVENTKNTTSNQSTKM